MSVPNRSFQKATKSSSSAGVPGRWNTYSAGVSPVRGLSPVRGSFHGVARQDIDGPRSHTNPLFTSRTTDTSRTTAPTKTTKENRDKQDQWKVPVEKTQYSGKTLCSTPGKSTRNVSSMRFTTPPKPVVKRKILAENREYTVAPSRIGEESHHSSTGAAEGGVEGQTQEALSLGESSIDCGAQKRTRKCFQDDGNSAEVAVPLSPAQCAESIRRLSLAISEESSVSGVEDARSFPELFTPYSPRPEFLRVKKSASPAKVKDGVSSVDEDDSVCQERTTPTYDPKHNFLSPRPQFLRYRPLRRLEILRRSAEGMLGDFDMESPAVGTDGDSSKDSLGTDGDSYKDSEKEDSESQDISQEIQSLKISADLRLPEASSLEEDSMVTVPNFVESEEKKDDVLTSTTCDVDYKEEMAASFRSEAEVEVDEEEDWLDDIETSSSVSSTVLSIVSLFVLFALVLVASGSSALLPSCLQQNDLSELWKTSKFVEPVRGLIRTAGGLWEWNPGLTDYPLAMLNPHVAQATFVHAFSFAQSVEVGKVVIAGKTLWSSGLRYVVDSYSAMSGSKIEEIDEFNWVAGYDFVVPQDIFDPTVTHETFVTWVKSKWTSLLQTNTNLADFALKLGLADEEATSLNSDGSSIDSGNSSSCPISSRIWNNNEIPSAAFARMLSDISIPGNGHISHEYGFTDSNSACDGDSFASSSTLEPEVSSELVKREFPMKILPFDDTDRATFSEAAGIDQTFLSDEEVGLLGSDVKEVVLEESNGLLAESEVSLPLLDTGNGHVVSTVPVESLVDEFPTSVGAHEQDLEQNGNAAAYGDDTREFHAAELSEGLQSRPHEMIDSSFLQKLRYVQSVPTVVTVGILVLLMAAGAAIIALRVTNVRSGKIRPADLNAKQHGFYHSREKSQNTTLKTSAGADSSSFEELGTEETFLKKVSDKDLSKSPERPFNLAANDRNVFMSSDMEILEDSSLGRFTALLPVVHNEEQTINK